MRATPGCGFWAEESVEFQFWLHLSLAGEGSCIPSVAHHSECANWSSTLLVKLGERIELDSLSVVSEFRCQGIMPVQLTYHLPESNLASCPSLVFRCPTGTGGHKQHTAKRQAQKKCSSHKNCTSARHANIFSQSDVRTNCICAGLLGT